MHVKGVAVILQGCIKEFSVPYTVDKRWLKCDGDVLETTGLKPRPRPY
jgi:hypothetical protein